MYYLPLPNVYHIRGVAAETGLNRSILCDNAAEDILMSFLALANEVKSEQRSSNKKKRRRMEGRMRRGGKGEGRKRSLCLRKMMVCALKKLCDTIVLKSHCLMHTECGSKC